MKIKSQYKSESRHRFGGFKIVVSILGVFLLLLVVAGVLGWRQYNEALKPVSGDQNSITVTIPSGSGLTDISKTLEDHGLIRKAWAFEWYVRLENVGDLQAGTYRLKPNMGVPEIIGFLEAGRISTEYFTILPHQRISDISDDMVRAGFSEAAVAEAMKPEQYTSHPALVGIDGLASLEGFLYPETFQRIGTTTPQDIVTTALDEMAKALTAEVRAGFAAQGLSVYQAVTLASIVENEVSNASERPMVAQVFLKRLREGMRLESNATDGYSDEYNTYAIAGLPPGPLTNVTASSLSAVAFPSATEYLFFVSGGDCITRFSTTLSQHEALKEEHGLSTQSGQCN